MSFRPVWELLTGISVLLQKKSLRLALFIFYNPTLILELCRYSVRCVWNACAQNRACAVKD